MQGRADCAAGIYSSPYPGGELWTEYRTGQADKRASDGALFYTFQVCGVQAYLEPDRSKRQWIRICSEAIMASGKPFADVDYHLGLRLRDHLEAKGHTVLWLCPSL
jgi:hypothetical protein